MTTISREYPISKPRKTRGRIGWFKVICAGLGGLLVAYSGMTLLTFLLPSRTSVSILFPFLFTPFAWSLTALWVSLSPTRTTALMRCLVPTLLSSAGIMYFMLKA